MYRVRAEKVSGKKVLAKGKWLICIGNKPVSVGDLIYTDGSCVYGFYQEAQQPPVIVSSTTISGIPIITSETYNKRIYCLYKNGNAQEITRDAERKDYNITLMINGYKSKVYVETAPNGLAANLARPILAANVDKQGNLYRMVKVSSNYQIEIWKNENCVKTISADSSKEYFDVAWAFIENENDWAYILAEATATTTVQEVEIEYDGIFYNRKFLTNYEGAAYFCNSEIGSKNIAGWAGCFIQYGDISGGLDVPEIDLRIDKTKEYLNCDEIKFPMQDGYYFTMSNMYPMPLNVGGAPWIAAKEIYSPNGNLIFSGLFPVSSYLTIYKNLIGVKDNGYLSSGIYQALEQDSNYRTPNNLINSGIYRIEAGELNGVLARKDAYYDQFNQRLRPMTKYKNWQENMLDMTIK